MSVIRIPTPLRSYTDGLKEIDVDEGTVESALGQLLARYPGVAPHLYNDEGGLRPYVNLYVNDMDVRSLQGEGTPLHGGDRLMIVPSIAGGADLPNVDHAALRANQASIILLLLLAFVVDLRWLALAVGLVMLAGTTVRRPGFLPVYRLLRRIGAVHPDVIHDQPEPHRFAQGLGGAFLLTSAAALYGGVPALGWALAWLVIALAALNLFGGFCVGCALYYWLQRFGVRGFTVAPPPGTLPGRRPPASG